MSNMGRHVTRRRIWQFLTVTVGLALGATGFARQTAVRVAPGQAPASTPARGQPKAVFQEVCGRCHPIERVTATRRTKSQWEETINSMVTSRGAVVTPEQYDTVLKYLVAEYSPESAPAPSTQAATQPMSQTQTPGRRGRGAAAAGGAGRPAGAPPVARGGAGPDDKQIVDAAAAMRGRKTYAAGCIQCHGTQALGGDRGPNLIRSLVVLHDRYGSELGPFLRKGHPAQGAASAGATVSASYTDAQVTDLSHFLHERLNDTLRGAPGFTVKNVLTGDRQAGAAYFDGAGGCRQCHSPTGDLAGIGAKFDPPTLQQRFLFPRPPGRGPRAPGAPVGKPTTVNVTTPSGETVSGELIHLDDFNISLRDASGQYRSLTRTPGMTVVKNDPYATHIAMLDKYTDKNIHDVVAYLESLK
jgi:cytochrome c oxidase cbb3-type subunit III